MIIEKANTNRKNIMIEKEVKSYKKKSWKLYRMRAERPNIIIEKANS